MLTAGWLHGGGLVKGNTGRILRPISHCQREHTRKARQEVWGCWVVLGDSVDTETGVDGGARTRSHCPALSPQGAWEK